MNGNAYTISTPINPPARGGQRISYRIKNTFGVLVAITWDTGFKLATWTNPANGYSRTITFEYDGTNWIEVGVGADRLRGALMRYVLDFGGANAGGIA